MCSVLLCEDFVELRRLVRDACEQAGHVVVGEVDGAGEAATLAARLAPDVVVLDLSSHGTPEESIRPLHDAAPRARIVAYTGLCEQELDAGARAQLAAHVCKTAPLTDLVAAIGRAGYATAAAASAS